jgi:hypothetical protein
MEKIRDSVNKELPPLRLYLDDLREVFEVLSKHRAKNIEILTCGYKVTNVDELGKLPEEQTRELYINSSEPYLHIWLTQSTGKIYTGDDSIESEGLASRIEKILLRGKIFYPYLPKNNIWIAFLLGLPLAAGILLQNKILAIIGLIISLISTILLPSVTM